MFDFSPIDYKILALAMLLEWVCQCPICGMSISWDNFWLTDRRHWPSDWSVVIWAEPADDISYGQSGHFEHLT